MTLSGFIYTLISALLVVAANLLLRTSILSVNFTFSIEKFYKLFLNPTFVFGLFLYGVSMLTWFKVMAMEALSISYPILVGLSFIGVTIGAVILFRESIPPVKIAGIAVVFIGIVIISRA